jgi:hypothetical protein
LLYFHFLRDKPIRLARQSIWDNFFSANVRSSIRNIEHCIQAAYHDAPFLHRLERMLRKFDGVGGVPSIHSNMTGEGGGDDADLPGASQSKPNQRRRFYFDFLK